jgi:hypothetical protein
VEIETLLEFVTPLSAIVGAASLYLGFRVYRRQMNARMFLEYTKRYGEVMASFPEDAHGARLDLYGDPPAASTDISMAVLRYLNLCSEEFYLMRRGYLARGVWRIWEDELQRTLRSPLVRREWPSLKREFSSFSELVDYVRRTLSTENPSE